MVSFLTGQPGRLPRPQLRDREGQDALPRQQRLRQARRTLRRRAPRSVSSSTCSPAASTSCRASTGHVIGGHGLDHAGHGLGRAQVRRGDPSPRRPSPRSTFATAGHAASRSRTARRSSARVVLSNADPKRTFLGLVGERALPAEFRASIAGIKMDGPCAKVNFVLSEEPQVHGMPPRVLAPAALPLHARALAGVRRALLQHGAHRRDPRGAVGRLRGGVERRPLARARGTARHDDCFVQYVPYRLKRGTLGREARAPRRPRRPQDRRVRAERPGRDPRAAGADAARPRAHLRADRGQHLPRRPLPRAALLHAAGRRLGAATRRRSAGSTSAARARTRAGASPARPGTTPRGRS